MEAYEIQIEKRLNMFENELDKVSEVIDDKDCTIASLKPSCQKTQESLELKRINVLDQAEAPILEI